MKHFRTVDKTSFRNTLRSLSGVLDNLDIYLYYYKLKCIIIFYDIITNIYLIKQNCLNLLYNYVK